MTQAPVSSDVPTWTVGDRLGKALSHAQVGVGEMATYLGLSRNSISAYINDRQQPKRQTLMLWAMRTGVSLEWLETGDGAGQPTPPGGGRNDKLDALAKAKRERSGRLGTTHDYSRRFTPEPVAA